MKQITIDNIEPFINQKSDSYYSWDKGDCSLTGLLKVLLVQELEKENEELYCIAQKDINNLLIQSIEGS